VGAQVPPQGPVARRVAGTAAAPLQRVAGGAAGQCTACSTCTAARRPSRPRRAARRVAKLSTASSSRFSFSLFMRFAPAWVTVVHNPFHRRPERASRTLPPDTPTHVRTRPRPGEVRPAPLPSGLVAAVAGVPVDPVHLHDQLHVSHEKSHAATAGAVARGVARGAAGPSAGPVARASQVGIPGRYTACSSALLPNTVPPSLRARAWSRRSPPRALQVQLQLVMCVPPRWSSVLVAASCPGSPTRNWAGEPDVCSGFRRSPAVMAALRTRSSARPVRDRGPSRASFQGAVITTVPKVPVQPTTCNCSPGPRTRSRRCRCTTRHTSPHSSVARGVARPSAGPVARRVARGAARQVHCV
jgi:hypothetical protein